MKRHVATPIAAGFAVVLSTGALLAAADPAAASAIGNCPNNTVCLYAGPNRTGTMIFEGNGSTLHDYGGYVTSGYLSEGIQTLSSANSTLGRFCTYNYSHVLTNILAPGTTGNLANHTVYWVKIC